MRTDRDSIDNRAPIDRIRSLGEELVQLADEIKISVDAKISLSDQKRSLEAVARGLLWQRSVICRHFDATLFADPATNLMLFIYSAGLGAAVSAGACCEAAGVPRTTGLRWIGNLEVQGLIQSTISDKDKRKTTISLTASGRHAMDECILELISSPGDSPMI